MDSSHTTMTQFRAFHSQTRLSQNIAGGGGSNSNSSIVIPGQETTTDGKSFRPLPGTVGGNSTKLLSYPLDVELNPQAGHFIMFTAKKRKPGKIGSGTAKKDFSKIISDLEQEQNRLNIFAEEEAQTSDDFDNAVATSAGLNDRIAEVNANKAAELKALTAGKAGKNKSILQQSLGTRESTAIIQLYMPPSVSVNYSVKYGDQEIGNLALLGKEAFEGFRSSSGSFGDKLKAAAAQAKGAAKEALLAMANASLDTFAGGARALSNISRGSVVTPRMELMFEGVGRRSFSYTFVFIPKSEQESKVVEEIVYQFKENMMPEYSNSLTRREMEIPNTFDIDYRYKSSSNSFLNKINVCFLQDVQIQYGADRFTAYESTSSKFGVGAPAQKTTMTLQFSELELLNKDLIKEGY